MAVICGTFLCQPQRVATRTTVTMSSQSPAPDLLSEDDEGIDETLIAMNEEFEKMLNAEIDEVAEISSRKSPRSLSPSPSVHDDRDLALDSAKSQGGAIKFTFDGVSPEKPSTVDDSHDDDDASFLEEMHALKEVEKQIEEALRDENTDSMNMAVQKIMNSPQPVKSILLQSADKRIINKILGEEKHQTKSKTMPENRIEQIVYMIRQDGLDAKETTNVLSILCILVWSVAFGLMRSVMHAEL